MSLFVFSSGYFWKQSTLLSTIQHKVKKLLIPYMIYNFVMVFIAYAIDRMFDTLWYRDITLKSILLMFVDAPITEVNQAAWFVLMLFWVSIIYCAIRKIIQPGLLKDWLLLFALMVCCFISVHISMIFPDKSTNQWIIVRWGCRTAFYMNFYHLGYMFRIYLEKYLNRINGGIVSIICILTNLVLVIYFGDGVTFKSTLFMNSFSNVFLPVITSVTGIVFYYEITHYLSAKIGETKITSFIARNTFVIMQVHLLFINVPNFYYYMLARKGMAYTDFSIEIFTNSVWYRYSDNSTLLGFFSGLAGSLLVAYIIEKIGGKVKKVSLHLE